MKQQLLSELQPVLEKFVDTVLEDAGDVKKIYQALRIREQEMERKVEEREAELQATKKIKEDAKVKIDKLQSDFEAGKAHYRKQISMLEEERSGLESDKKEVAKMKAKLKTEIAVAEDTSFRINDKVSTANKEKDRYNKLLKLLKKDTDSIDGKKEELTIREKKLQIRDDDLVIEKTKLIDKAHELNDQELQLKAREAEVQRLIKRYNLEATIGV